MARSQSLFGIVLLTVCALGIQPAFAQKPLTKDVPPSDGSTDGGPACWDTCPADPTHDGVTNIDDLLAIINAWGVFGGYTDVNHDGVTNIDDLPAVTSANLITCNDDTGAWCNTSSRVRFQLSASSCYLVRVGGYGGASGTGYMRVLTWINGDECINAIDLGTVTSTHPLIASGNTYA